MTVSRIACIGAGYVGAPTSAVIAMKCPEVQVVVLDISQQRIDAFNSDKLPIYEPGLQQIVEERRGKNLHFSTDIATHIAAAEIIMVSVNTPTKQTGIGAGAAADLSSWEAAGRSIAQHSTNRKIVVEKSTVPVRTAAALSKVLEANRHPQASFDVLSNPEFLAEGTAINDLLHPDRILIGGNQSSDSGMEAQRLLTWVYAHWIPIERILLMDIWSSELSKLVANAFLAQRVSSINSIAQLCEKSGADISEVARAIGMDTRIGSKFLNASIGFGGSCFKKDVLNLVYICESHGLKEAAEYWLQTIKINEHGKSRFVAKMVKSMFNTLNGKKIAIFGFAFKKDTADVRETPALDICISLLEEGATLNVYDPLVTLSSALWEAEQQKKALAKYFDVFKFVVSDLLSQLCTIAHDKPSPNEAVDGADAICVLTEWDEFKLFKYEEFFQLMRKPAFVFDGRILLDHDMLVEIGYEVRCIGKSFAPTFRQVEGAKPYLSSPPFPTINAGSLLKSDLQPPF